MPDFQGDGIPFKKFINKLHDLGYKYDSENGHVKLFRKGTHFVSPKKNDYLSIGYVASALRQCGCTNKEIDEFIGCTKVNVTSG
jgi:hypothetical protein